MQDKCNFFVFSVSNRRREENEENKEGPIFTDKFNPLL